MITDALQKITSWVEDPQLTEMEKFVALHEYSEKTLLPEVNEQQVQQYYTGKFVSLSPEYIRAADVAFFVGSHWLGFLCAHYNVPKEKWADLASIFMDAVRETLNLPGRPYGTPDPPLLRKAIDASWERRYELAKQGYFTIEEVQGWGARWALNMITNDALQKITSWVQNPQLTEMEKFVALYEYSETTLLPEVYKQRMQENYTKKSVSLSPEYIRASDVAFFVDGRLLGFLCARYNVPKEKWADLAPIFMDAVREILSLPGRPYDTPDFPPLLRKALDASLERRYELAKQGYFTNEEVQGWGEMGH